MSETLERVEYNGEVYSTEDPNVIVCETDGEYYHIEDDEIIKLEGNYYRQDDENLCCISSGEYRFLDDVYMCESCNEYFDDDEGTMVNGNFYCETHFNDYYVICEECEEPTDRDNYYIAEDRIICEECYSHNYHYCESCDESFHNDHECDCNGTDIHSYCYKPDTKFYSYRERKSKTSFIGFELESENIKGISSNGDVATEISEDSLFYCKADSSLDNGFEVVSHPLSFTWYRKNKKRINAMIELLKDNGFRSYTPATCGLHIHISKDRFSKIEIYKILKFFKDESNYITILSQRNNKGYAYCKKNDGIIVKDAKSRYNNDRFTEVNLTGGQTIEFRFFRGTTNISSFHKAIEFVFGFTNFVKTTPINGMNTINFHSYLNQFPKTYKNLLSFIKSRGL